MKKYTITVLSICMEQCHVNNCNGVISCSLFYYPFNVSSIIITPWCHETQIIIKANSKRV